MILTTLLQPPEAPPEAPESARPTRPARLRARERSRRYGRVVAIGIALSVLLHALIVFVSPVVVRYLEAPFMLAPPPPRPTASVEGMRVIDFRITETPAPVERVEETPPEQPSPEPTAPAAEAVEAPTTDAEPLPTAAERLRPRVGDWRLWVRPPLSSRDATRAEREAELRRRLYADIEAYNDSMAAEAARRAESLDWTVGEEGNRWGLSPGKIHLGPITLPLPLDLGPHPAVRRDMEGRRDLWEAIQRQAGQGSIDDDFNDRVKAIRERKARERADEEAQRDTTSGG